MEGCFRGRANKGDELSQEGRIKKRVISKGGHIREGCYSKFKIILMKCF